jgi:hypothetical protein
MLYAWRPILIDQITSNLYVEDVDDELLMYSFLEQMWNDINEEKLVPKWGSSTIHKLHSVKRNNVGGHDMIMQYYFCDSPIYNDWFFLHHFKMKKSLFMMIMNAIVTYHPYFV